METVTDLFGEWLTLDKLIPIGRAIVVLAIGWSLSWLIRRRLARRMETKMHAQQLLLVRTGLSWLVFGLACAWALRELGFDLTAMLGAAGLLTVALGFAAQTSVSNVISGLFLMGERPFVVGDIVEIDGIMGEVLHIDLMSVRIRKFDNLMMRVPNEMMLKSKVITVTHFPLRRVDLPIGVAYKEDLERVRELLFEVADKNPLCLEEPPPLFIFRAYGESSLDFQLSVWGTTPGFLELRNSMWLGIKAAFDEAGIEIPFPHRTLYTGSETSPLPVQLIPREGDGTEVIK